MIFKMRTTNAHAIGDSAGGWLWLDGITKVQDYGQIVVSPDDECASPSRPGEFWCLGIFAKQADLSRAVDTMWGPMEARSFAEELWPEFTDDTMGTTVTCVRLERADRSAVLALLRLDAFLLDDSGRTIERLR